MALFGNGKETKEEKQERKNQELLAKYGLENMTDKDLESIRNIINDLMDCSRLEWLFHSLKLRNKLRLHICRHWLSKIGLS